MATKTKREKPELTAEELDQVVSELVLQAERSGGGDEIKLKRGALSATAQKFGLQPGTVGRIWKRAHQNYRDSKAFRASPQKKGNSGRKIKWDREKVRKEIAQLPAHKKQSFRQIQRELGIPKSTLHGMKLEVDVVPHKSSSPAKK